MCSRCFTFFEWKHKIFNSNPCQTNKQSLTPPKKISPQINPLDTQKGTSSDENSHPTIPWRFLPHDDDKNSTRAFLASASLSVSQVKNLVLPSAQQPVGPFQTAIFVRTCNSNYRYISWCFVFGVSLWKAHPWKKKKPTNSQPEQELKKKSRDEKSRNGRLIGLRVVIGWSALNPFQAGVFLYVVCWWLSICGSGGNFLKSSNWWRCRKMLVKWSYILSW